MFQQRELETLRLRKELLVLKGDTARLLLVADLQRLSSPQSWLEEAAKTACRHPVMAAVLGGGVGLVAVQALRRPGALVGWVSRLGALGSTAISLWKLFAARKRNA